MVRLTLPFLLIAAAAGCAAPQSGGPSLAPRASEAIDPRVPLPSHEVAGPVAPALAARLAGLRAQAEAATGTFEARAAEARAAAASAGDAQSESWIAAQQLLSAAVAARAPVTQALGDIDALAADAVESRGGLVPGDRKAVEAAAAAVGEIDRHQAATIEAIAARLAR